MHLCCCCWVWCISETDKELYIIKEKIRTFLLNRKVPSDQIRFGKDDNTLKLILPCDQGFFVVTVYHNKLNNKFSYDTFLRDKNYNQISINYGFDKLDTGMNNLMQYFPFQKF